MSGWVCVGWWSCTSTFVRTSMNLSEEWRHFAKWGRFVCFVRSSKICLKVSDFISGFRLESGQGVEGLRSPGSVALPVIMSHYCGDNFPWTFRVCVQCDKRATTQVLHYIKTINATVFKCSFTSKNPSKNYLGIFIHNVFIFVRKYENLKCSYTLLFKNDRNQVLKDVKRQYYSTVQY